MKSRPSPRCRALLERLSLYVDNDLPAVDRGAIRRHLRHCPCCEQFVEELRRTTVLCEDAGHRRLPAEVRARAHARIAELLRGFRTA